MCLPSASVRMLWKKKNKIKKSGVSQRVVLKILPPLQKFSSDISLLACYIQKTVNDTIALHKEKLISRYSNKKKSHVYVRTLC